MTGEREAADKLLGQVQSFRNSSIPAITWRPLIRRWSLTWTAASWHPVTETDPDQWCAKSRRNSYGRVAGAEHHRECGEIPI